MARALTEIKGVGEATAERLAAHGLATIEAIAAATPQTLAGVPGFGASRADAVRAAARELLAAADEPRGEKKKKGKGKRKGKGRAKKKGKKKGKRKKRKDKKDRKRKDKKGKDKKGKDRSKGKGRGREKGKKKKK